MSTFIVGPTERRVHIPAPVAPARVTQEGRVYRTRKGAQNYIDGFLAEVDLGWYVLQVTAKAFIIVRPYIDGDERHSAVHTLSKGAT